MGQWKKNAHGDHIDPSAQKKKIQKIGMVTDKITSRGPTTPKTFNISKSVTFLIGFPNRSS